MLDDLAEHGPPHSWVYNGVQLLPLRLIVENDCPKLLAIEASVREQYILSKLLDYLLEGFGTRQDDHTCQKVGINDLDFLLLEELGYGGLSCGYATGETNDWQLLEILEKRKDLRDVPNILQESEDLGSPRSYDATRGFAWVLSASSNYYHSTMRGFVVSDLKHHSKIPLSTNVPEPKPGPGQVLVDVYSAGLNFFDVWFLAACERLRRNLYIRIDPTNPRKASVEACPAVRAWFRICREDIQGLSDSHRLSIQTRRPSLWCGTGSLCRQSCSRF